ncbi:hypothetical protein RR48_02947 [Papilio machaon]|uniref:Uncharacterized protein n=1 Tax=Papilio machaon TaxID=76193 RepID=A0A0N1ICR6_PAPMA|nr:hypothetical protein RR48_02947 [Papilio machaon]
MRSGVVSARQCTPPRRDCSAWMSLMVPDGGDYPQRALRPRAALTSVLSSPTMSPPVVLPKQLIVIFAD